MTRFRYVGLTILTILAVGCASGSSSRPDPGATASSSAATNAAVSIPTSRPALLDGPCRPGDDIPPEERANYCTQHDALVNAGAMIARRPPTTHAPEVCGNLVAANNHRGTALLAENASAGARLNAQRLKELGASCVTIAVSYPLLLQDASGKDGFANAGAYLAFYRDVVAQVRKIGLKVNIESGVMFTQADFTTLPIADTYAALRRAPDPIATLRAGRINVIAQIARELAPDYLSIGSEPDVAANLLGDPRIAAMFLDPDRYAADVEAITAAVKGSDRTRRIAVGAGIGSWIPNRQAYVDALVRTSIDYVDLHVYPIVGGGIESFVELADHVRKSGKAVGISEAWLFKASGSTTSLQWAPTLAKDALAYWQPLDVAFMHTVAAAAKTTGTQFVSFFGTQSFFAYGSNDAERTQRAAAAIASGTSTPTGKALASLTR